MMNRASTINTIRTNEATYSPDLTQSPIPPVHRNTSIASRTQDYRQPTRALRISNPDQELIESDSSNDDSTPLNQQQQQQPRYYQPTPSSFVPDPELIEPVATQPTMTQKEKVPLKINTNHLNKPKPNLPPEALSQAPLIMDTEKRERHDQDIPDRSSLVSPLHFNSNDSILNSEKPKTSTHLATEFAHQNTSKYAKVSYHLTNDPGIIKMYRDAAEKTNDPSTQLLFAKYLLETASLFRATTNHSVTRPIGSLWGVSPTKKNTKPQPFKVIQEINGEEVNSFDGLRSPLSNMYSTSSGGKTSTVNVYQQQAGLQLTNPTKRNSSNQVENKLKSDMLQEEGMKWIKKLAKQNVPEACYILAKQTENSKQQRSKLIYYYQVAAKGGIPEAMYELASMYEEDKQDPATFLKLYLQSSKEGYVNAIYRLAIGTLYGEIGLRQSTSESLKLMHRATEYASEEFSEPCYTFGLMLLNEYAGADIPFDQRQLYQGKEAGILYLERAAGLGNPKAQAKLGSIYEHGSFGETMNFAKAFDYYNSAALQGNARAMLGLCRFNMKGSHGPRDTREAERLQGDVSGWLAATPYDEDAAFEWCRRAAEKGYSEALAMLGWFYESGFGVPRDMTMAENYYALAAEAGNSGAKQRLFVNTSITRQQHSHIQQSATTKLTTGVRKSTIKMKLSTCYCM